jgi:hypothetical protein
MKQICSLIATLRVLPVLLLLAFCFPMEAEPNVSSGKIVFPARGLYSLQEGTIESWVKFDFDPNEPVEGYTARGELFRLVVSKADNDLGAEMNIFFASLPSSRKGEKGRSFTFLRAGFAIDGQEVPHPLLAECLNWKRDEWHHVAVTWKEARRMAIYFDGRIVVNRGEAAEREFPYSIERDIPAGAQLILGSPFDQQPNSLTIDEFRLSSVARSPSTLGFVQTPLKPDPFTMLLENFENVKAAGSATQLTTTPEVVATATAPPSYIISDGRLVSGKSGLAWAIAHNK